MSVQSAGSLTSAVYRQIRAEILACRLRPGEKLTITDLCQSLGVSLGAVREALSRLTSEGLVEAEPHRGFRVAPVTQAELEDLTRVRVTIESECLASAIANGDLKWETGIVSTLFELSRLPLQDSEDPARVSEVWVETHRRFHEALVASCDSPWLLRTRAMLYAQSERYRMISVPLDRAMRDIHSEHKAIADAAIDRNISLACQELKAHLERTTRILAAADVVNIHNERARSKS